jgi:hypothetical protein
MGKWKFLLPPELEIRPLGRPARGQLLYRLRYPGPHPNWSDFLKFGLAFFLLKLFRPSFLPPNKGSPVCPGTSFSVSYLIFALLPRVRRPHTGSNRNFVLFSFIYLPAVWLCLYSRRFILFVFFFMRYIHPNVINIFLYFPWYFSVCIQPSPFFIVCFLRQDPRLVPVACYQDRRRKVGVVQN